MSIVRLPSSAVLALSLVVSFAAGAVFGKPLGDTALAALDSVECSTPPGCIIAKNTGRGAAFVGTSRDSYGLIASTSANPKDHLVAAVYGSATSSAGERTAGLMGSAESGLGVLGRSSQSSGVSGETSAPSGTNGGVLGRDNATQSKTNAGVLGISTHGSGVMALSTYGDALSASSQYGNGVTGTGPRAGVAGTSSGGSAVSGSSYSGIGVYGVSNYGFGVLAAASSNSGLYASANVNAATITIPVERSSAFCPNGDTLDVCGPLSGNVIAGFALDSSLFFDQIMVLDSSGDLTITGELYTGGSCHKGCSRQKDGRRRRVVSYGSREAAPTIEDVGTARLRGGRATVTLDPAFANVIDDSAPYHVFVTPQGDSRGLYVTNIDKMHFDVRENQGGRGSIPFDYRIVARPFGDRHARLPAIEYRPGVHRGPVPKVRFGGL